MTTFYGFLHLLACILPFVVGIGLVYLAAAMSRRKLPIGLIASGVVAVLSLPVLSLAAYYLPGGLLPLGALIFFTSIPAALVACGLALYTRRSVPPDWRRWYLVVAGIVIPFSLFGVPSGSLMPMKPCDEQDRIAGVPIIAALESYQSDHGAYPRVLQELVPQYLSAIPTGPCHAPSRLIYPVAYGMPDFYLCEDQHRLMLQIPAASRGYHQGYDLTDKKWRAYDDLDFYCPRLGSEPCMQARHSGEDEHEIQTGGAGCPMVGD